MPSNPGRGARPRTNRDTGVGGRQRNALSIPGLSRSVLRQTLGTFQTKSAGSKGHVAPERCRISALRRVWLPQVESTTGGQGISRHRHRVNPASLSGPCPASSAAALGHPQPPPGQIPTVLTLAQPCSPPCRGAQAPAPPSVRGCAKRMMATRAANPPTNNSTCSAPGGHGTAYPGRCHTHGPNCQPPSRNQQGTPPCRPSFSPACGPTIPTRTREVPQRPPSHCRA